MDDFAFRPEHLPAKVPDRDFTDAVRLWLTGAPKAEIAEKLQTTHRSVTAWIDTPEWRNAAQALSPEVHALVGGSLNRLKTQALTQLADRIEHGDPVINNLGEVVLKEDGTAAKRPMKGKDLVEVFAKLSDAQVQLEKMIGNIKDDDDESKISLDKLALGLKRFAEARDITGEATPERPN